MPTSLHELSLSGSSIGPSRPAPLRRAGAAPASSSAWLAVAAGGPGDHEDVPARSTSASSRAQDRAQATADACCERRPSRSRGRSRSRSEFDQARSCGSASTAAGAPGCGCCALTWRKSTAERSMSRRAPLGISSPPVRRSASCAPSLDARPARGGHPSSSCARGSRAPWRDAASWAGMSAWSWVPRLPGARTVRTAGGTNRSG